jgi:choline dehydrogenase
MTVIVDLLYLLSEGEVKLVSADLLEQADINLNFFSDDLDIFTIHKGVR